MSNFPGEILNHIFIYLPMIQKLECMLVCRQWKDIILKRSLFYNISCPNTKTCTKFYNLVKEKPSLGAQVNYLKLCGCFNEYPDKTSILHSFTNLREINLDIIQPRNIIAYNLDKYPEPTLFPSKLEAISENGLGEFTCSLAASGLCSQLISLELNLVNFQSLEPIDVICQHTKNMSVLKRLKIWSRSFKITHCEIIHNNIPSLESLVVHRRGIDDEDLFPGDIQPATSIKMLSLELAINNLENQKKWVYYIARKYPSLRYLHFNDLDVNETYDDLEYEDRVTIQQFLSSSLVSLNLTDTFCNQRSFAIVDDFGCKIRNLFISKCNDYNIPALYKSKQFEYIEKLYIETDNILLLEDLKNMKNLKSLSIECGDSVITTAARLFDLCPDTLEVLTINTPVVYIADIPAKQYAIKSLTIAYARNIDGMSTFISNCFPYLQSLTIQAYFYENETFIFRNYHFSHLELYYSITLISSIALTTLDNNKTRYYDFSDRYSRKGKIKFEDYIAPIPQEKVENNRYITVVCASVKDLVLGDLHASFI